MAPQTKKKNGLFGRTLHTVSKHRVRLFAVGAAERRAVQGKRLLVPRGAFSSLRNEQFCEHFASRAKPPLPSAHPEYKR